MRRVDFDTFIENKVTRAEMDEELFHRLKDTYEQDMNDIRRYINDLKFDKDKKLEGFNIILFGPAGSGKSSFIRLDK